MNQPHDIAQGVAGAATTAAATTITWLEQANAIVDIAAGIAACAAAIFTCVWTYYRIKEMKNK